MFKIPRFRLFITLLLLACVLIPLSSAQQQGGRSAIYYDSTDVAAQGSIAFARYDKFFKYGVGGALQSNFAFRDAPNNNLFFSLFYNFGFPKEVQFRKAQFFNTIEPSLGYSYRISLGKNFAFIPELSGGVSLHLIVVNQSRVPGVPFRFFSVDPHVTLTTRFLFDFNEKVGMFIAPQFNLFLERDYEEPQGIVLGMQARVQLGVRFYAYQKDGLSKKERAKAELLAQQEVQEETFVTPPPKEIEPRSLEFTAERDNAESVRYQVRGETIRDWQAIDPPTQTVTISEFDSSYDLLVTQHTYSDESMTQYTYSYNEDRQSWALIDTTHFADEQETVVAYQEEIREEVPVEITAEEEVVVEQELLEEAKEVDQITEEAVELLAKEEIAEEATELVVTEEITDEATPFVLDEEVVESEPLYFTFDAEEDAEALRYQINGERDQNWTELSAREKRISLSSWDTDSDVLYLQQSADGSHWGSSWSYKYNNQTDVWSTLATGTLGFAVVQELAVVEGIPEAVVLVADDEQQEMALVVTEEEEVDLTLASREEIVEPVSEERTEDIEEVTPLILTEDVEATSDVVVTPLFVAGDDESDDLVVTRRDYRSCCIWCFLLLIFLLLLLLALWRHSEEDAEEDDTPLERTLRLAHSAKELSLDAASSLKKNVPLIPQKFVALMHTLRDKAIALWQWVKTEAPQWPEKMKKIFILFIGWVVATALAFWAWVLTIPTLVKDAFTRFGRWLRLLPGRIRRGASIFYSWLKTLPGKCKRFWLWCKKTIPTLPSRCASWFKKTALKVGTFFTSGYKAVANAFVKSWTWVKTHTQKGVNAIGVFAIATTKSVTSLFGKKTKEEETPVEPVAEAKEPEVAVTPVVEPKEPVVESEVVVETKKEEPIGEEKPKVEAKAETEKKTAGVPLVFVPQDVKTRTGKVCTKDGKYVCKQHAHRTANMKVGKRFPPCLGDDKGHAAEWILTDEED